MVSTDVAARGLDIKGIENVIHYQMPRQTDIYVHRSGRTARAGTEGLSVLFVSPEDLSSYRRIIHDLNRERELPACPVEMSYFPCRNWGEGVGRGKKIGRGEVSG